MQNINIAQLNFISKEKLLSSCMPPCLTFTENKSFGVKGFDLTTQSIPTFIPKLYTNTITATTDNINVATDYIYNFNDTNNKCIDIDDSFNPSFNYNGQRYSTTSYPSKQTQANLYSNDNPYVKYFHCFDFTYFLTMIETQIQTLSNGVIFNYNSGTQTVSLTILKSYIDNGNTIAFNKSFFNLLPFIFKYHDGIMNHVNFNKKFIINIGGQDYYTTECYPNFKWFSKLHIGSETSDIQATEFPATNQNMILNQSKKIIMSFRFNANSVILPNNFQAENDTISIFHKFNRAHNNENLDINIYLQVKDKLVLWSLDDGDSVNLDILVYQTN